MSEFEEWAAGYMKRARVEEENTFFLLQQWRDSYEAGYLEGYGAGRGDTPKQILELEDDNMAYAANLKSQLTSEREFGRRAGMEEAAKISETHKEPASAYTPDAVYRWSYGIATAIRDKIKE
jgi:hypothetical protein